MKSLHRIFLSILIFSTAIGSKSSLGSPKYSKLKLAESPTLSNKSFWQYNLIPGFFDAVLQSNTFKIESLSSKCKKDIEEWLKEIRNNLDNLPYAEPWALQMIDAWGKPLEGLLSGHVTAMGDFDECLGVRSPTSQKLIFKGQYCINYLTLTDQYSTQNITSFEYQDRRSVQNLLDVIQRLTKSDTHVSPTIASCLPSSCSKEDVQTFVQEVFEVSGFLKYQKTSVCYIDEKPLLSVGSVIMIVILGVFGVLIIISSAMDILNRYEYLNINTGSSISILLAFSLPKNSETILSTESPPGSIGCLNGMRFISAFWIVLGHTFYSSYSQSVWNLVDIVEAPANNFIALLISTGTVLVVDTFLTITSVLLTLSIFRTLDSSNGRLNFLMLFIRRYIRLTPMYAILIGLTATLFPYASNGPKWITVDKWSAFCRKNWWKNLLYINNLPIYNNSQPGSDDSQCLGHAWYLAVDMQLYLLSSFLIIYPLWRWKRIGKIILLISTLISMAIPIIVTYSLNLNPTSLPFRPQGDFNFQGYMATWMKASPFMMGIWTGYFLYKTRLRIIFIPKLLLVSSWFIVAASAFAVVFGIQQYFYMKYEISRVGGMFYAGFHHAVWGVCMGWIIFSCARGYGGWVNMFLSWKVFIPLGKLTFAIYLVHLPLEFIFHFEYRQPINYSLYNEINLAISHLVVACFVAFIFSVTTELPFIEISKILLGNDNNSNKQMRSQDANNTTFQRRNYGTATSAILQPLIQDESNNEVIPTNNFNG